MEVKATAKFIRISPKKVQPMVKALRGMKSADALSFLKFHPSKTARLIYKLIHSAVSNAVNNYNLKEDNLRIKHLTVNSAPTLKRYWFRSHGSADPLLKRNSHLAVTLEEIKPTLVKKTVAKPTATVKPTTDMPEGKADTSAEPIVKQKAEAPRPKIAQGLKKVLTRRTTNK